MVSVFFRAQSGGCWCEGLTGDKELNHCPPQALLPEASRSPSLGLGYLALEFTMATSEISLLESRSAGEALLGPCMRPVHPRRPSPRSERT